MPPRTTITTLYFILLLCSPTAFASPTDAGRRRWKRDSSSQGYIDPRTNGGMMLTFVPDSDPVGLGEPLNMIISANSDATVLVDQQSNGGLRNFFQSFNFSSECLGQHSGTPQEANLGDGHGLLNETAVIRYNYGDPTLGTCKESVVGGNHFRYWTQNGPLANSGAIFMAVSSEEPISEAHNIIPNGYNLGRDYLIGNITGVSIPTLSLNSSFTISGTTSSSGFTYQTNIHYVAGLLQNSSDGVNHADTVATPPATAVDGLVAVLTVTITGKPPNSNAMRTSSTKLGGAVNLTWIALLLSFFLL